MRKNALIIQEERHKISDTIQYFMYRILCFKYLTPHYNPCVDSLQIVQVYRIV